MRWWLVLALAACGDNDAEDAVHGGSRLAVQWNAAEDGTRVPTGTIHDLELDRDCYPQDWADGARRCTQVNAFIAYSDTACSQPIVIDAQATDAIAGTWDEATCKLAHTYRVGAAMGSGAYYWKSATGCMPSSTTMLYAVGPELAPDTFAKLERIESGDSRLHGVHLASSDGFMWPWQTFDTELQTTCSPGDLECDPYSSTGESYLDPACTQRVTAVYHGCGDSPSYASVTDACGTSSRTYRLGAVVKPTALYSLDSAGTCSASSIDASAEYHTIGSEVTPAETSRRYAVAPGHRLQQMYYAGSGVAVTAGLFDSELGVPCIFNKASDGVQRCVPFFSGWQSFFSNPGCGTIALVVSISHSKTGCALPPPPVYAVNYGNDGAVEVRVVGGRYTGMLYRIDQTGACGQVNMQDADYYVVGDEVAPESFVALTSTSYN